MARGRKYQVAKKKKGLRKNTSHSKDKKRKKYYDRDIKHRQLILQSKSNPQPKKPEEIEDTHRDLEIDNVDLLLSTFSANKFERAVSESESEFDEAESAIDETEANKSPAESCGSESDEENEETNESNPVIETNGDPYVEHFGRNLTPAMASNLLAVPVQTLAQSLKWPVLGDIRLEIPRPFVDQLPISILDNEVFAKCGETPQRFEKTDPSSLCIRPRLHNKMRENNKRFLCQTHSDNYFTALQRELFAIVNNYQDILYPERTIENGEEIRFMYCLHAVNHVLKTQAQVLNNNERLLKKETMEEFRDQGLVRPKVLILAPFRDSCYRIVNTISELLLNDKKANIINKSRFNEEFTGGELFLPKKNKKPEDFEATFSGNVDDNFRIGLSFTKKSLKLYADFYSSDIIIASPLGLRMLIGAEGERDRDYDFLSSVEILILDQADIFLMQNWDHVLHLLNHLHLQPRESHGTDFSRVWTWALNGWSKHYRQTLVFSSILLPELVAILNRSCSNYAGSTRVINAINAGSISRVVAPLPHVYRRFNCDSIISAADERFKCFVEDILPQLSESSNILLFVPSYFDYVRLRNYLKAHDYSFVQICEYSKDGKVARARDMFYHSEARLLLYSERFHFFRRINLKGIRHLIFYQPPTYPIFYSELCNYMQESYQNKACQDGNYSVTVLFCKYDIHQLAGIIRTDRARRIASSEKAVHLFTTGQ